MGKFGEIARELVGGLFNRGDQGRNSSLVPMHTTVPGVSDKDLLEAFQEQCVTLQRQLDDVRESLQKAQKARQETAIRAAEYQRQLQVAREALQKNAQSRTTDEIRKELLLQLFPLLNDLERSFGAVPSELKGSTLFTSWYRGILLNSKRLHKTLEGWGLTPLASEGQNFDPSFHEAIAVDADADQPWGTIARIEFQGYALGNMVLQPARVVVSENRTIRLQPQQA